MARHRATPTNPFVNRTSALVVLAVALLLAALPLLDPTPAVAVAATSGVVQVETVTDQVAPVWRCVTPLTEAPVVQPAPLVRPAATTTKRPDKAKDSAAEDDG